ncbi:MAG: tetraacyldisaccharide 4'-kinase, partial [Pseudoalteromonas sp.]
MSKIEQSWYKKPRLITFLLLPLSGLFWLIATLRKFLYSCDVLRRFKSDVPIIVVGNISVGGNGKTPFVIWLGNYLASQGLNVGVISRGYGGKSDSYPLVVKSTSCTTQTGDEPVLIKQRLGCPVVVGPNREDNIKLLSEQYSLHVIISDDGMQHYKMPRVIECCIVDSVRRFGNGFLIPAGPLRESTRRLNSVDLVIENGGFAEYNYQLQASNLLSVVDNQPPTEPIVQGHAVSAIGNPTRFEESLQLQGIKLLSYQHFRDHHAYTPHDFAHFNNDIVIMTEKD